MELITMAFAQIQTIPSYFFILISTSVCVSIAIITWYLLMRSTKTLRKVIKQFTILYDMHPHAFTIEHSTETDIFTVQFDTIQLHYRFQGKKPYLMQAR